MKVYDPNELPKLVDKAIKIASKGDVVVSQELFWLMNDFCQKLDDYIAKYDEETPFKFKIEPIRFKGDDDEKRQNR